MKKNKDYEIEVKFRIADPFTFRNRILALHGQSRGRFFEKNILFDTPEQNLEEKKILLRLRQSENCLLTLKSPAEDMDPEFKILKELETKIDDFEAARKILHVLGFSRETPYEKYRENFFLPGLILSLDELPFGHFVELEAEKEEIRHWTEKLGLQWQEKITENYMDLFLALGRKYPKDFPCELTFAAFAEKFPDGIPL